MLNRYPLWKTLLIVLGLAMGGLYALPNLYPDDLAVQISGASSTTQIDQSVLDTSLAALAVAWILVRVVLATRVESSFFSPA